jgi:hypothetical protein
LVFFTYHGFLTITSLSRIISRRRFRPGNINMSRMRHGSVVVQDVVSTRIGSQPWQRSGVELLPRNPATPELLSCCPGRKAASSGCPGTVRFWTMAIAAGSWMSRLPRVCLWVMLWLLPTNCKIHKSIRKTNVSTMLIPFK